MEDVPTHLPPEEEARRPKRIFTAFEPTYWQGMVCTFGSLLRRTEAPIIIDVLTREEHRMHLAHLLKKLEPYLSVGQSFNVIHMPYEIISRCDDLLMKDHFKSEACFRLFYFDLIEVDENVLYIDIDTIVLTDVQMLSDQLTNCAPVSALESELSSALKDSEAQISRYFNSGVILFNIIDYKQDIIRLMHTAQDSIERLSAGSNYLDQDALNIAFTGKWTPLPPRLNYTSVDFRPIDEASGRILHATGSRKPWFLGGGHRFSKEYDQEMAAVGIPVFTRYQLRWLLDGAARRWRSLVNSPSPAST